MSVGGYSSFFNQEYPLSGNEFGFCSLDKTARHFAGQKDPFRNAP
jgi:hypothetical protein